jgi:hypothetical protein
MKSLILGPPTLPSFSKNSSIGFEGMAFIAEFGIMILLVINALIWHLAF